MKTTYFKFIAQKTFEGKTILVAVIPDNVNYCPCSDLTQVNTTVQEPK